MAASDFARSATKLPGAASPSGGVAVESNNRRMRARMAGEVVPTGSLAISASASGRDVPFQVSMPKPPVAGVSAPDESG